MTVTIEAAQVRLEELSREPGAEGECASFDNDRLVAKLVV